MNHQQIRNAIVAWGRSFFERGLTSGSSGNISVRIEGGFITTPTNSCLGFLVAERLSVLDENGSLISGDAPTKELPLHFAFYAARPDANAIVHLHSTYATAISCLQDVDRNDAIPVLTPYAALRLGRVPLLPYVPPGSPDIIPLIAASAGRHPAVLLGNHGPVVSGRTLDVAVFAIEELEEAAKLALLTKHLIPRRLTGEEIAGLTAT